MADFQVTTSAIRSTARGPVSSGAADMAGAAATASNVPTVETGKHFQELGPQLQRAAQGISEYLTQASASLESMASRLNAVADNYEANEAEQTAAAQTFFKRI